MPCVDPQSVRIPTLPDVSVQVPVLLASGQLQTCKMIRWSPRPFLRCRQSLGSASPSQASLWERLAEAPDIHLALSTAWGCTVEEATAWMSTRRCEGHDLRELIVNWSKCPLKQKQTRGKMITCIKCRIIRRSPGALTQCGKVIASLTRAPLPPGKNSKARRCKNNCCSCGKSPFGMPIVVEGGHKPVFNP